MKYFLTYDLLHYTVEILIKCHSLAIIELQIVTALFFRYFNVKLDPSTKPEYMEMKVVFSGSPIGEKVFLNLQKDGS